MTILDADFLAWTRSARRRPVELVEFNVTDETEAPKVLRVATRRYTTATHVYRGHRVDFELDWEMEPDVAGYSEPQLAHQQMMQRLLDQSIRKRRDAECPHSARGLGMSIRRTGCGTYSPASSLALTVGQ